MCFDHDLAGWYAEIQDVTEGVSETPTRCDECFSQIGRGAWRRHIYQQESEICRLCEEEDGDRCPDGECDYGETYAHDICSRCCQLLKAIEAVEEAEGCPPHSRQPLLGELWDVMRDEYNCAASLKYARKAVELFPDLGSWDRLLRVLRHASS
jgi:hypothetical protein